MTPEDRQPYEPDSRRALDLVIRLMAIPGRSGEEAEVASFVERRLRDARAPASAVQRDSAHRRTPAKRHARAGASRW
mgnify:CR=1 FL=1